MAAQDVERLLLRMKQNESGALDALIAGTADRLEKLARKMLRDFPKLERWVQAEDVYQNAIMRLARTLRAVKPTDSVHYFRLAAFSIRRELLDLKAHYFGRRGIGANHQTGSGPPDERGGLIHDAVARSDDEKGWALFHHAVGQLPPEQQEMIGLVFYDRVSLEQAAMTLGMSASTLKRRLRSAKEQIRLFIETLD